MSLPLPNEIVCVILSHLDSQRYLAECSRVCSAWYHIVQPLLYSSIAFYSPLQLGSFLAAVLPETKRQVRRIAFDNDSLLKVRHSTWTQLQRACPFVTHVTSNTKIECYNNNRHPLFPFTTWHHLQQLPAWRQEHSLHDWHPSWHGQLTHLSLAHSAHPFYQNIPENEPIQELPYLPCLTHLTIRLTYLHALNEEIMESLHRACPRLAHLTLIGLESPSFDDSKTTTTVTTTSTSLKTLQLLDIVRITPETFVYLLNKYRHSLTALVLRGHINMRDGEGRPRSLRVLLLRLVTELPLVACSVVLYEDRKRYGWVKSCWPGQAYLDWMRSYPQTLARLHWPYDLEDELDVSHLTHLTLTLDRLTSEETQTLLVTGEHPRLVSLKLTVYSHGLDEYYPAVDLTSWLALFPRLHELAISGCELVSDTNQPHKNLDYKALKRLDLYDTNIKLQRGFTLLCQWFPSLTTLHCEKIQCGWLTEAALNSFFSSSSNDTKDDNDNDYWPCMCVIESRSGLDNVCFKEIRAYSEEYDAFVRVIQLQVIEGKDQSKVIVWSDVDNDNDIDNDNDANSGYSNNSSNSDNIDYDDGDDGDDNHGNSRTNGNDESDRHHHSDADTSEDEDSAQDNQGQGDVFASMIIRCSYVENVQFKGSIPKRSFFAW